MDDSKKISIKKYLEVYKTKEDIEILFKDIAEQMEQYHNEGIAIGDFTTDNLYIGEDGNLGFYNISGFQENKEQENDNCKYLILLMSAYLKTTEQEDVKEKLKENSKLLMDDVIDFYSKNKNNLPPFKEIHSIASNSSNGEELGGKGNSESKGTNSKSLVKSNGHSLVPKDKYKPNAFVSLFVFPFVMISMFLILALLYWMIVLK